MVFPSITNFLIDIPPEHMVFTLTTEKALNWQVQKVSPLYVEYCPIELNKEILLLILENAPASAFP
jgi:hypothetical protein